MQTEVIGKKKDSMEEIKTKNISSSTISCDIASYLTNVTAHNRKD